jgi:formamidopyrimidine-DNA glycosylase
VPELPDITNYLEALERRIAGKRLERARIASPFLLRTAIPPIDDAAGRRVAGLRRFGKRIVIALEGARFLVLHLMIAGRLRWEPPGAKIPPRLGLAALDFEGGSLVITEAGTKRRASLHYVEGEAALRALDPGGVEVIGISREAFEAALRRENHTLKRALTDPRLFAGIGNAYSDEILHRARLSPAALTGKLGSAEAARLWEACGAVLREWIERLRAETGGGFPTKVTAFREGMAVHGRYRQPCPDCGEPVQRILHGDHETNYCARCQTGGRLLADRALSALLKADWPKTLDEWEEKRRAT